MVGNLSKWLLEHHSLLRDKLVNKGFVHDRTVKILSEIRRSWLVGNVSRSKDVRRLHKLKTPKDMVKKLPKV